MLYISSVRHNSAALNTRKLPRVEVKSNKNVFSQGWKFFTPLVNPPIVVIDTAEADALAQTVDEACSLLANYNSRLSEELAERKRVAKMLRNYITSQKNILVDSESKLQVTVWISHLPCWLKHEIKWMQNAILGILEHCYRINEGSDQASIPV